MKSRLMDFLQCPDCRSKMLTLHPEKNTGEEIVTGRITCSCGSIFPILRGIPRLLPSTGEFDRATRHSFSLQWLLFPHYDPWCWEVDWIVDDFRGRIAAGLPAAGRTLVDVGCGQGKFTAAVSRLGYEVVGLDLSDSVGTAAAAVSRKGVVHFVQGTIEHCPLRPAQFDFAFSSGVLHHTPSTRDSFKRMCALARPDGAAYVWLYRTLPPAARESLEKRRQIMRRRHPVQRFLHCLWETWAGDMRFRLSMAKRGKRVIAVFSFPERVMAVYDGVAPPFNHMHEPAEVVGWFKEEGFVDARDITLPVYQATGLEVAGRRRT